MYVLLEGPSISATLAWWAANAGGQQRLLLWSQFYRGGCTNTQLSEHRTCTRPLALYASICSVCGLKWHSF